MQCLTFHPNIVKRTFMCISYRHIENCYDVIDRAVKSIDKDKGIGFIEIKDWCDPGTGIIVRDGDIKIWVSI